MKTAIKITTITLIFILGIWISASLKEVYDHNTITFNGGSHEYHNWNIFIVLFEEMDT